MSKLGQNEIERERGENERENKRVREEGQDKNIYHSYVVRLTKKVVSEYC